MRCNPDLRRDFCSGVHLPPFVKLRRATFYGSLSLREKAFPWLSTPHQTRTWSIAIRVQVSTQKGTGLPFLEISPRKPPYHGSLVIALLFQFLFPRCRLFSPGRQVTDRFRKDKKDEMADFKCLIRIRIWGFHLTADKCQTRAVMLASFMPSPRHVRRRFTSHESL